MINKEKDNLVQIALIRCGKTESGDKDLYIGKKNEEILQSEVERISQRGKTHRYPPAKRVYTSPWQRCRELVPIIYPNKPAIVVSGLGAYDFGDLEGKPNILYNICESHIIRKDNRVDSAMKMESVYGFLAKVDVAFQSILNEIRDSAVRNIAIITHESVIMAIVRKYVIPKSLPYIVSLDYGAGLLMTFNIEKNFGTIDDNF